MEETQFLEINDVTRTINVPSDLLLGVLGDKDVERVYFRCPKIVGDNINLAEHQIYVKYVTAPDNSGTRYDKKEPGIYHCQDVIDEGEYITFSWKLSGHVFEKEGFVAFSVLAADGEVTRWNTFPAIGTVLITIPGGLEEVAERYPDVITQLLNRMDEVEAIAAPEAMQEYVNTYLAAHPAELDPSLTDNTKAAPANLVGELKEDLGDLYGTDSNNILNSSKYTPNKIKLITGEVRDSDVYDMFELLVETGVTYNFSCYVRAIVIYDSDNIVQTAENVRTITAENTKAYVSIRKSNSANYKMFKDGVDGNTVSNFGEKNLKGEPAERLDSAESRLDSAESRLDSAESRLDSVVLYNENMLCGAEFKENYNFNASVAPSTSYNLFTNIPVKSGVHYTISPKARIVIITEKTVQNDGDTGNVLERINTGEGITEHTPTHDGYMQLTVYKNDSDYLLYTDDAENVYPSDETHLSDSVVIPSEYPTKEQVKEIIADKANDTLFGKKWIHCGDSFSWGSESALLTEGKYEGRNKVFPFIIGNRTSIEVVDTFFRSGRTLAFPENPGSFSNSITCPTAQCYYQNIPDDTDYITIYLGINDGHHDTGNSGTDGEVTEGYIGLGTIDDNTTATYYGAWNVVLSWLLEHRPFAHIGIIVSNGVNDNSWRLAQIEIAKKYGIPYIDLNGDEKTPVMIRSVNPDVSQTVKTVVNRKQAVDPDGIGGFVNLHPNDYAHEYESTFIESFLRSI